MGKLRAARRQMRSRHVHAQTAPFGEDLDSSFAVTLISSSLREEMYTTRCEERHDVS